MDFYHLYLLASLLVFKSILAYIDDDRLIREQCEVSDSSRSANQVARHGTSNHALAARYPIRTHKCKEHFLIMGFLYG